METINFLTKEEAMELAFKIGYEGEAQRTNCAQEVFHAITSVLGIKNHMLFKSLSALEGGGAVSTFGSCGAFNGALVVFSYFFGRSYEQWQNKESYIKSSILGQKLFKKFKENYGTVTCREIHKVKFGRTFDLMDEKNLGIDKGALKDFEDMGAHENVCPTVVGQSAYWAIDILWEHLPKDIDLSDYPSMKKALQNFEPKKK